MEHDDKNPQYWNGAENRAIRHGFYCLKGVDIFNMVRNPIWTILGIYAILKLDNPWWIVVMTVPSIIVFWLAGYLWVHRVGRVFDYLTVRFSTHYAKKQFDIFEGMLKELRDMNAKEKNVA